MRKYRPLLPGELVQVGDRGHCNHEHATDEDIDANGARVYENDVDIIGRPASEWEDSFWWRLVDAPKKHNWIKFSDRAPTEADSYNGQSTIDGPSRGDILRRCHDKSTGFWPWNQSTIGTHWMPLNFVEDKPAPVTVGSKALFPQADGSVKISCGTVIPSKDVDELIRQRQEVMK